MQRLGNIRYKSTDKPSKVDDERELRRLDLHINDLVNEQDRQIRLSVQQDLRW
jgi:hypothetical protein